MARNLVLRADGKLVNVVKKKGQLFICATGCCCGHTERKFAPVPTDLYHNEWEQRKLRNKVHLTQAACLGPCPLANVALLIFDGHPVWFHSVNSEGQVVAIYDYIEQMLEAQAYLPPPPELANIVFEGFDWEGITSEAHASLTADQAARMRDQTLGALKTRREPGILFLTHADTDLLTLHTLAGQNYLPADFPRLRAANPAYLKSEADVDTFLDNILNNPEVETELVVLRLLGGRASFAHGVDRLVEWARREDKWLVCLPGTDALDPELMALSTVGVPIAHEVLAYLQLGGPDNYANALRLLADHLLTGGFGYEPPTPYPAHGLYYPGYTGPLSLTTWESQVKNPDWPTVGILFYRAHYLAGNLDFVDEMVRECQQQQLNVLPVFAYSLKEKSGDGKLPDALAYFVDEQGQNRLDTLICTMSFAMGGVNADGPALAGWSVEALTVLDVPVLQAITAGVSRAQWEGSSRGLNPLDTAMNVALPEFDGRLITVPISFKETVRTGAKGAGAVLDAPLVKYVPDSERIRRVIGQARRWAALRHKPNREKRIAFIFTNSPGKAARIGNAVGLDAPASLMQIFAAMQSQGYQINNLPESSDQLLSDLIDRCSYDVEVLSETQLARAAGRVPAELYAGWYERLPRRNQTEMAERWGNPPGIAYVHDEHIALAGLEFGNAFVALQPPRGYGMNPDAIYHVPDLAPTHNYYALYRWLQEPQEAGGWGADAIVHVGKHGTLEWLPGKGIGLSAECYPDQFLGDLPLLYPFIINNPGEGVQAKRRAHAVIVDHMVPPMMQAETYGELTELAQLVDEYYQLESLDPAKLPILQKQIWDLMEKTRLDRDLAARQGVIDNRTGEKLSDRLKLILNTSTDHGDHTHEWDGELNEDGTPVTLAQMSGKDFAHLIENIDGYLCELAGAQIRNGLHILGQTVAGAELTGLLFSLTRLDNLDVPSLRASVAAAYGLDLGDLLDRRGARLDQTVPTLEEASARPIISGSDAVEAIDQLCHALLDDLQTANFAPEQVKAIIKIRLANAPGTTGEAATALEFVCREIWPNLERNREELDNLLAALAGRYVPAGPAGAPTRGMAHVLPTGRNFYAVDPRSLPSMAAWQIGQALAQELLQRYLADENSYPESVGLSIWGTSAMRTHGDDIAQALALMGVRPLWQVENRRLLGVEVIPLAELGRPRIDVICRISGFFRDAFPHLINLLDEAVRQVVQLDEPLDMNFPRKHYLADQTTWQNQGLAPTEASERAIFRIYGSKPGAYGAGILPLIDEGNWQDTTDFAEAYVNWGGYAYTARQYGTEAREAFRRSLSGINVAVKNQDNREHDIFDSDDYLQYHGGMIAAIRALSGKQPRRYFGDNSDPERIAVRDLKEEALRVFRSRVVNPKWLESIKRHGYKGGLELAATVDYLFGYDATSEMLEDWMYQQITETYLLDDSMRKFLEKSNPWARREMSSRLLEAVQRGLWKAPSEEILEALRETFYDSEDYLEMRGTISN